MGLVTQLTHACKEFKFPVEIGVQGKYTISCKLVKILQVMHAVREGPKGIAQFSMCNFPN